MSASIRGWTIKRRFERCRELLNLQQSPAWVFVIVLDVRVTGTTKRCPQRFGSFGSATCKHCYFEKLKLRFRKMLRSRLRAWHQCPLKTFTITVTACLWPLSRLLGTEIGRPRRFPPLEYRVSAKWKFLLAYVSLWIYNLVPHKLDFMSCLLEIQVYRITEGFRRSECYASERTLCLEWHTFGTERTERNERNGTMFSRTKKLEGRDSPSIPRCVDLTSVIRAPWSMPLTISRTS